jgi:hypothetical protein
MSQVTKSGRPGWGPRGCRTRYSPVLYGLRTAYTIVGGSVTPDKCDV